MSTNCDAENTSGNLEVLKSNKINNVYMNKVLDIKVI